MYGEFVYVENLTVHAHHKYSSVECSLICIYCTVENCLQLKQILIVPLLMLHINIVGVVTCSDNSTRRFVTCIIGSFLEFISVSHYAVPLLQCQHHSTRKNSNLTKCYQFLSTVLLLMNCKLLNVNITSNFRQFLLFIIIYLFQATRPIVKKRQEKQTERDRKQKHTQNTKEHNYTRDTVIHAK